MKDTLQILIRMGMKTFAGYLVTKAFTDQATADQVSNGVGAGLILLVSLVWSHVHLSSASAPATTAKPVSLLMCGLLLTGSIAGVGISGCSSTPQGVAYQTAATTETTVDAAMTAWGAYVAQFHPPASQEAAVKAAYEKYQAAAQLVVDSAQVWATLSSEGATNLTVYQGNVVTASQYASQALTDLVNLLTTYGVKL